MANAEATKLEAAISQLSDSDRAVLTPLLEAARVALLDQGTRTAEVRLVFEDGDGGGGSGTGGQGGGGGGGGTTSGGGGGGGNTGGSSGTGGQGGDGKHRGFMLTVSLHPR